MAEDILRILEISNQVIPEELRGLVKNYKERKENGEVDKYRISGYVGRGNKIITSIYILIKKYFLFFIFII